MLVKRKVFLRNPEHIYTDEFGIEYLSVTQAIKKVTPEFKTDYWQIYKALQASGYKCTPDVGRWEYIGVNGVLISLESLKLGIIPMEVKQSDIAANWKELTDVANFKGTKVHDQIEHGTKATQNIVKKKRVSDDIIKFYHLKKNYPQVYQKIRESLDRGYKAFPEKIVYLHKPFVKREIAGMIDLPLMRKILLNYRYHIKDWKTNKNEFRYEAGYFKKDADGNTTDRWIDTFERMLYPLNHLANSVANKYTLQVSMYTYMLECWGMEPEPEENELCHIRGDFALDENEQEYFDVKDITWHKIAYMRDEAKSLIEFIGLPIEEQVRLQREAKETINF